MELAMRVNRVGFLSKGIERQKRTLSNRDVSNVFLIVL